MIGVQMFALIGMLFSIFTMGDCSFFKLDDRLFFPEDLDPRELPLKVSQTQYVGFLTWQQLDGYCYFYNSGVNPNGQIEQYMDILGQDFDSARFVAMASACLSFVYFCYLLSFTCSSQTQGCRRFNAIFLSIFLTGLQGVTFLAFRTDFCEEYGCTFSRSAGFCVAAMACFFLSGLCFLCAKEYPGDGHKTPKLMRAAPKVAPSKKKAVVPAAVPKETPVDEEYVMEDYDEEEAEEEVVEEDAEEEVVEEEYVEEEYTEGEVEEVELGAGEDMTLYTEVTADDTKTIQTITHLDGSQTVTESVVDSTK